MPCPSLGPLGSEDGDGPRVRPVQVCGTRTCGWRQGREGPKVGGVPRHFLKDSETTGTLPRVLEMIVGLSHPHGDHGHVTSTR